MAAAPPKPSAAAAEDANDTRSPTKPAGILLTPGTATARRKRVSFGHDVRDNAVKKTASKSGLPDECPGKFPSPWVGTKGDACRPRTRLTETMEKARQHGGKSRSDPPASMGADEEEAWEEVEDLDADPDITVDLNEPHSRSGRYWKSEFQRYQEEAKVQMGGLVKYKQLAKSYAKKKDAEAMDMSEKLKEEKDKVANMERRITELTGQIARKRMKGTDNDTAEMIRDLTRQTALAVQYRNQVKELETIMKNDQASDEAGGNQRPAASPRTHNTLLEAQRELRRARQQVKQLGELKDEVRQLKAALRAAQQRERAAESSSRRLEGDLARTNSRMLQLEERAKLAEDESRQKAKELRQLQREYETATAGSDTKTKGDAEPMLRRRSEQIPDIKRQSSLHMNDKEAKSVQDHSSKEKKEEPWNQGLAELQAEFMADENKRSHKRDAARHQFETTVDVPSSPVSEVQDILPRRGLRAQDRRAPMVVDVLEDDDMAFPLPANKEPSGRPVASASSRYAEKRSSSAVLRDRTTGNSILAEQRAPATHRVTDASRQRRAEPPRVSSRDIEESSIDIWAHIAPEPVQTRSLLVERGTPAPAARYAPRPPTPDTESPKIDLLRGKFGQLGGPDVNSSAVWTANSSKSNLPPERRAAALARVEQKRAERKRLLANPSHNKENVRPW